MMVNQEVTIDFSADDNDTRIVEWLKENRLEATGLSDLAFTAKVDVVIGDLDEDDIVAAYDKLNKLDDSDMYHVEQAYRRMAEGDVADAMDILFRQFNLAPPARTTRCRAAIARKRVGAWQNCISEFIGQSFCRRLVPCVTPFHVRMKSQSCKTSSSSPRVNG